MSDLKPCPFCGGEAKLISNHYFDYVVVRCSACGASSAEGRNGQYISSLWQTRPIEDELNARIAELEAEIERLTVHSDIERQDDNYSNHTQTQTIVYQKECEK